MKIIVTGGAGFVGSTLCLKLKQKYPDYTITAFDNLKRRGSELSLLDLKEKDINFIHGDIRNAEDFESIGHFDTLIEASAEPSVLAGLNTSPNYVINNNLYGSINCFNLCFKFKAKLIFLSSSRVYPIDAIENANYIEEKTRFSFAENQNETGITPRGISENLKLEGARSFYGATKLASELFLQEYAAFYGLQAAITRFGVIAGPRQMGKSDQGVATLWLAKHYWKKPLKYIGYGGLGKQVRDILHIDDVFKLIDLQIHKSDIFNGKIFNAGGGILNSISLLEMTKICEEITGNKLHIESETENRPGDLRIYITDNKKITNEIGWSPQKSIQDIFKDTFLWIQNNEKALNNVLNI